MFIGVFHVFSDQFKSQGNHAAFIPIETGQDIDAFDVSSLGMIEVPGDDFVFIGGRFFFNRIVEEQEAIVRLNAADGWFDQFPEILGGVVSGGEKPGDPVVTDLMIQQSGESRGRRVGKRTHQIVGVEIEHVSVNGFGCVWHRKFIWFSGGLLVYSW